MSAIYTARLKWTGGDRGPALDPKTFSRDLTLKFDNQTVLASAAPEFSGDPDRVNPEEMLLGAVSACQALTYLFLAARKGVHVVSYEDRAEGTLAQVDGRTQMTNIVLHPVIGLETGSDLAVAEALIDKAHAGCFVANSLNAPVTIEAHFGVVACVA